MEPALHEDTGLVFYMTKHKLPIMARHYVHGKEIHH